MPSSYESIQRVKTPKTFTDNVSSTTIMTLEIPPAVFSFNYSQEEYNNEMSILNELTPSETMKVNDLLNYIDKTELQFKRPENEIKDIVEAVDEAVDSFVQHIGNCDPIFAISHKYAVGSMAERTKIVEPDEFDFIFVLKEVTEATVDVETIFDDNIHKNCTCGASDFKDEHYRNLMPEVTKCRDNVEYRHVHLPLKTSACTYNTKKFPKTWRTLGYIFNWKSHLMNHMNTQSLKDSLLNWNTVIHKSTGTLKNQSQDHIYGPGPALTKILLWEPNTGEKLNISVDLVLAAEMNGIRNALTMKSVSCPELCKALLENDKFFLVPITGSSYEACFKITCTTKELNFMKSLSHSHILCYRILKYLFQWIWYPEQVLNSYLLKTFIIWHTSKQNCCNNPSKCLIDLLKLLAIALKLNDWSKHLYPETVVQHLFIPGLVIDEHGNLTKEETSQFLDNISKQLFKAGKSENEQLKHRLQGLKDAVKKINDERMFRDKEMVSCIIA